MYKPRAPIALDDKSYDLSLDCLTNKKTITLSQKSTPTERRVYRLLKEKRYSFKDIIEPIPFQNKCQIAFRC